LLIGTIILLILLFVNMAKHGGSSWGRASGGGYSLVILFLQFVIAVLAVIWASLNRNKLHNENRLLVFRWAWIHMSIICIAFVMYFFRIMTSMRQDGSENLVFFLFVAALPTWVGIYRWIISEPDRNRR